MQGKGRRIVGSLTIAVGIVIAVIAMLLFGLTKTSNGETTVDWISIMTAIGGVVIAGRGLHAVVRNVQRE